MAQDQALEPYFQAILDRVKADERKRESAEIIQLPLWAAQQRGIPNSFLRS